MERWQQQCLVPFTGCNGDLCVFTVEAPLDDLTAVCASQCCVTFALYICPVHANSDIGMSSRGVFCTVVGRDSSKVFVV